MTPVDSKRARAGASDEAGRPVAMTARFRREVSVAGPQLVPISDDERTAAIDAVRAVLLPPARERPDAPQSWLRDGTSTWAPAGRAHSHPASV